MTKHEFLKQLKAELAGLPGAERRRQVGFLATQRVDGKLILPEAVKVLQMKAGTGSN